MLQNLYSICVIDIGSPKLGNIGWCIYDVIDKQYHKGTDLLKLYPLLNKLSKKTGLLLGLEAPLFVPLRANLLLTTKARKGEGKRPWSAGAGAQVLALNLPIMVHIFKNLFQLNQDLKFIFETKNFKAAKEEILIFEALVSGVDKGVSHIDDAEIMVKSCKKYLDNKLLPNNILEVEPEVEYFNLAAAALYRAGYLNEIEQIGADMPIFKPD